MKKYFKSTKLLVAGFIVFILLLAAILLRSHTPLNITVRTGTTSEATSIVYTQAEKTDSFAYQSTNLKAATGSKEIYFSYLFYDLQQLKADKITITSPERISDAKVEVGYLLNNQFQKQASIQLSEQKQNGKYIYTINATQIKKMIQLAQEQTLVALIQISFLVLIFLIFLFAVSQLSTIHKISFSILLFLFYFAAMLTWTTGRVQAKSYSFIALFILALIMLGVLFGNRKVLKKPIILGIYLLSLFLSVMKLLLIRQNFNYVFDQNATIGYIDSLAQNHTWLIPDYANMVAPNLSFQLFLKNTFTIGPTERLDSTINYLGHPPLYYQIMRLLGARVSGENTHFNYILMLSVTMAFFILALAIFMYIAYTRLKPNLTLHLLVVAGLVGNTFLFSDFFGLNNDSLAFLLVAIFALGAFRFFEQRYNTLTYLLIFGTISLAFLTKMTALVMIVVIAFALLVYDIWKNKHPIFKEKNFWLSALALFPAVFYAVAIFIKYHALSINIPSHFPNLYRYSPNFGTQEIYKISEPFHTLAMMISHIIAPLTSTNVSLSAGTLPQFGSLSSYLPNVAFLLVFGGSFLTLCLACLPTILKKFRLAPLFAFVLLSLLVTLVMLIAQIYPYAFETFRIGGYQPRYFIAYLPFAVLSLAFFVENVQEKIQENALINPLYQPLTTTIIKNVLILISMSVLVEQMVLVFVS